jgi:hypothetical protein
MEGWKIGRMGEWDDSATVAQRRGGGAEGWKDGPWTMSDRRPGKYSLFELMFFRGTNAKILDW